MPDWNKLHSSGPDWLWVAEFALGGALILGLFFAPAIARALL